MSIDHHVEGHEATVVGSVHGLEALRAVWDRAQFGVDADLDYFRAVVESSPGARPHVVHARTDGDDVLVVGRIAEERLPLGAGSLRARLSARALLVSFDGVASPSSAGDAVALRHLLRPLEQDEADLVVLQKVDVASRWFDHVVGNVPARRVLVRPAVAWHSTDLPGSWDELLAARTSKSRRQLRFDDNKVRRTFGERLQVLRLDAPEHRHRLLPDIGTVAAASYQRGLGVSVLDSEVQSALLGVAGQRGWLRVWMTYVDDVPVAFWWGVVRRGVLSIGSPGFDPAFARDRLGHFTLRRLLEDACADPAVRSIDYGPGEAEYKSRFGTRCRTASDVLLFAPRLRPRLLRAGLLAQDRATATARSALERSGSADVVRRRLRRVSPQGAA